MRIERKVAARYAEALLGAVGQDPDRAQAELAQIQQTLAAAPELRQVLQHPEIPLERKDALVERIFGSALSAEVVAFLKVLLEHDRMEALPEIAADFANLVAEAKGVVEVQVTSAVPLTPEEESTLSAVLGRITGKRITLAPSVDPEVLAGVAVRIGDRLIDGTARQRLEALREQLKSQ